ncbi:choice-of-anchor I family protein [Methylomonas sp. MgM2]
MLKKRVFRLAAMAAIFPAAAIADDAAISFEKIWTHTHVDAGQVSEIPAYDHKTNTIWVAGVVGVDVLDADSGRLVKHIDVTDYGFVNSVAIHNGLAAFAIEDSADRRNPGSVVFFDTKTLLPSAGENRLTVGSLPDMLTFTHDGSKLLVANEATPNAAADEDYTPDHDPAGSVSIIDTDSRSVIATAGFAGVPTSGENLRTDTGMDFEPEYIAPTRDGSKAFVTLQEANGVGVLDLTTNEFTQVIGLGLKDFSLADNGFGGSNFIDPNDKDGEMYQCFSQVKGLYQPDAVASYEFRGRTYMVMANEGDTREDDGDKKRVKDVEDLQDSDPDLQRLNISTTDSEPGNPVTFGGRSFSIRDEDGVLVYDSGNLLDAEAIARDIYNDSRSDDKGMEPEGVTLAQIAGRTYAFIGLERTTTSAVAVFDVTNPFETGFVDMIVTEGDVSPEGMAVYKHRGDFYLAIANEVSNTTSVYRIDRTGKRRHARGFHHSHPRHAHGDKQGRS